MVVLNAEKLNKIYGSETGESSVRALYGMDVNIEQGEFIGVMGPSGSGKTTLLNILSGIDKPTSGIVNINGRELSKLNKNELAVFRRNKLGFVFQEFNLLDSLTIKENIMLPMILDSCSPDFMEKRVNAVMRDFDIDDIAQRYPYNVSGGQKQRAAVARAIINSPVIVFADEPTGNLDSHASKKVMRCFEKMNKEGSTIFMVTHDPFAASFCRRIIFIKDGCNFMEIARKGDAKEFLDKILDCLAVLGGDYNEI